MLLQEAAGVHTWQRQEAACTKVRGDALRQLHEADLAPATLEALEVAITVDSISMCAINILMTPEILYLPSSVKRYLLMLGVEDNETAAQHRCMRLGFVCSPHIYVHYHNVWDTERQHLHQVCAAASNWQRLGARGLRTSGVCGCCYGDGPSSGHTDIPLTCRLGTRIDQLT